MNLEKFIEKTLVAIPKAIREANDELFKNGVSEYSESYKIQTIGGKVESVYINFDVAVAVATELKGEGDVGADIQVLGMSLGEAKVGGEASYNHENVSRVKFKVCAHSMSLKAKGQ